MRSDGTSELTDHPAGEAVLNGNSPYPHDVGGELDERAVYAYPPPLAFLVAPFTVPPDPRCRGCSPCLPLSPH